MFSNLGNVNFADFLPAVLAACAMLAVAAFAWGSNPNSTAEHQVVIYARYSSDKQRETSIDDQVRNVRIHLDKLGTPDKVTVLESRLKEIASGITNITKAIETAFNASSATLMARLTELESEKAGIERECRLLEAQSSKDIDLPSMTWIRDQLVDLADVFMDDQAKAAVLFRQFFGKVRVHIVVAPGKKRGHPVLEFTPNRQRLFASVAGIPAQESWDSESSNPDEVVTLTLAGSDKLDNLMPTIDEMRQKGITWKQISKTLKISKSWGNRYYNIWKGLTQEPQEDQADMAVAVSSSDDE